MKIKKSQLKLAVKNIVREAISEHTYRQALSEVSPPGAKAERMIHHVKASLRKSHPDWDEDKVTSVAIATGWKAHNKGSVENEQVGANVVAEMGPESKMSVIDGIVRLCIQKFGNDEAKIREYVPKVFKAHTGWDADPEAVEAAIQRGGSAKENGEEGEGGYDEREEILLIKVMELIAKKLSAMHSGQALVPKTGGEEPAEEPAEAPPFGGGEKEEEPETEEEPEEEPEEKPKAPPFGKKEKEEVDEEAYKTVSPRSYEVQKDDKARTIQTDPQINEKKDKWIQKAVNPKHKGYCTPMTKSTCTPRRKALAKRFKKGIDEASYKVVAPNETDTAKEDKARKIQTEPKVTENHKVQHRSYKTVNDQESDPKNVRDPEVPQA